MTPLPVGFGDPSDERCRRRFSGRAGQPDNRGRRLLKKDFGIVEKRDSTVNRFGEERLPQVGAAADADEIRLVQERERVASRDPADRYVIVCSKRT